jgi:FtsH-binding integral membrane protein
MFKDTKAVSQTFINRVFGWMFIALLISAFSAFAFASSKDFMDMLIVKGVNGKETATGLAWIVMLLPLIFGLLLIFGYEGFSEKTVKAIFLIYSAVNGVSFSLIIHYYTTSSLISCFVSAAAMFAIMAIYGYVTKKDLSSWGSILLMALFGLIIVNLVTLFTGSTKMMDYIIGSIGVIVFCGLTAYDIQKLKDMAYDEKGAVMGAFQLYLDFVNIFLYLLRIFGVSSSDD